MTNEEYSDMVHKLAKPTIKCVGCGIELVFSGTDNMCSVCREDERKDRFNALAEEQRSLDNDPRLKVYSIIMYERRKHSELVTDTIIVLASSEEVACALVFSTLGIARMTKIKDYNYHINEIEGPFTEGSILYRTEH